MKQYLYALLLAGVLGLYAPATQAQAVVAPAAPAIHAISHNAQPKQIHHLMEIWLDAISTGNADAVTKLYATHAVLLPTLSATVRTTPAARKDYFDHFTAKEHLQGVVDEEHIQIFGNTAVNSGRYTFTFTKDDEKVTVPARYSFVYHKTAKGWLIVDHHSSKLPEEP